MRSRKIKPPAWPVLVSVDVAAVSRLSYRVHHIHPSISHASISPLQFSSPLQSEPLGRTAIANQVNMAQVEEQGDPDFFDVHRNAHRVFRIRKGPDLLNPFRHIPWISDGPVGDVETASERYLQSKILARPKCLFLYPFHPFLSLPLPLSPLLAWLLKPTPSEARPGVWGEPPGDRAYPPAERGMVCLPCVC